MERTDDIARICFWPRIVRVVIVISASGLTIEVELRDHSAMLNYWEGIFFSILRDSFGSIYFKIKVNF